VARRGSRPSGSNTLIEVRAEETGWRSSRSAQEGKAAPARGDPLRPLHVVPPIVRPLMCGRQSPGDQRTGWLAVDVNRPTCQHKRVADVFALR